VKWYWLVVVMILSDERARAPKKDWHQANTLAPRQQSHGFAGQWGEVPGARTFQADPMLDGETPEPTPDELNAAFVADPTANAEGPLGVSEQNISASLSLDAQSTDEESMQALVDSDQTLGAINQPALDQSSDTLPTQPIPTAAAAVELQAQWDAGFAAGLAQAQAQFAEERISLDNAHAEAFAAEHARIAEFLAALEKAARDLQQFAVPIERLSLHLAQQLVRGELSQSGQAIKRLVAGCLATLEPRTQARLMLHPEDLLQYQSIVPNPPEHISLHADEGLRQGSVRLLMDDGAVEDLIEHRLDALAQALLGPVAGQEHTTTSAAAHDALTATQASPATHETPSTSTQEAQASEPAVDPDPNVISDAVYVNTPPNDAPSVHP